MKFTVEWKGDEFRRRVAEASRRALDGALEEGIVRAKQDHPGWKSITGETERSLKVEKAKPEAQGAAGLMLSTASHFVFLEIGARGRPGDHTLRRAGDVAAAGLPDRIRTEFGR